MVPAATQEPIGRGERERGEGEGRGGGEGERRGWERGGSVNLWFRCDITNSPCPGL